MVKGRNNSRKAKLANPTKEQLTSSYDEKLESQGRRQYNRPQPMNEAQSEYMWLMENKPIVIATGPAGTSKTFLASSLAAYKLVKKEIKKIIIARPNVPLGETVGFLKGSEEEKLAPLVAPMKEAMLSVMSATQFQYHYDKGNIEFCLLEYIKGRSFNNCIVIIDEVEDCTVKEIKSIMTRIGSNSTMILAGDICQQSIDGISGLAVAQRMARDLDHIGWIDFELDDVVRSGACYENIKWMMENGFY